MDTEFIPRMMKPGLAYCYFLYNTPSNWRCESRHVSAIFSVQSPWSSDLCSWSSDLLRCACFHVPLVASLDWVIALYHLYTHHVRYLVFDFHILLFMASLVDARNFRATGIRPMSPTLFFWYLQFCGPTSHALI